jgi:DNA-binding CsgD family transcriptional regulator
MAAEPRPPPPAAQAHSNNHADEWSTGSAWLARQRAEPGTRRRLGGRALAARSLSPDFVAREAELAKLEDALQDGPAVVLVEGEAGVGKTRLLQEFTQSAAGRTAQVLVAQCLPFRQPHTLGPLVDAVRQAAGGVARFQLSALAGALRPLFPEWADELPTAPEPAEDATAARHRVFRALAELLGRLRVTVLVVEDAHWADEATLEFLLFAQPKVSLVISYRPEEVPAGSQLLRLSSRPPPGAVLLRLALGPLDAAATESLVSSMLGGEPVSAEFGEFVHRWTEGLPLAVEELVRLMHDRCDLAMSGRGWVCRPLAEIAVPPTLRDAVLERAARLDADTNLVLRASAVLAAPAHERTLAAVAGLPRGRARAGLAVALGCGMLADVGPGMAAFRHVLAARAVHEAITSPDRRILHRRAARALERQPERPASRLANHYREAGETAQWCHYAEQAADEALAAGDEATAFTLLHGLLTGASLQPPHLARLAGKIPLGTVAGHARCHDLAGALRAALGAAIPDPPAAALIRVALARVLRVMHDDEATVQLEQAIPHLDQDSAEAAWALTMLSWPGDVTWPASLHLRWLRRAARMPPLADPAARLRLTVDRASVLLALGDPEGWDVAAEIPLAPANVLEARQVTRAHKNIGESAMIWGRYGEARHRLDLAGDLAASHGYARLQSDVLIAEAHLDWFVGAWDGLSQRAADLACSDDLTPLNRLEAALVAVLLQTALSPPAEASAALRHLHDQARLHDELAYCSEPAAALAMLHLADGRTGEALEVTREPVSLVQRKQAWVWAAEIAPARAAALAAAGRTGEAEQFVAAFARGLHGRNAPGPKAGLALSRAILAEAQTMPTNAALLYARAAAAWQALPRPFDALLARERQAACLLAAGRAESAAALLTEVYDGLARLGAQPHAERIAQQLHELGVGVRPVARRGRRGYGDQLSPRELDVVRLVVSGKTNSEIARALVLSPTTVSGHVKSALRKFRVSSRTTLAVRAAEAGIAPGSVAGGGSPSADRGSAGAGSRSGPSATTAGQPVTWPPPENARSAWPSLTQTAAAH